MQQLSPVRSFAGQVVCSWFSLLGEQTNKLNQKSLDDKTNSRITNFMNIAMKNTLLLSIIEVLQFFNNFYTQ
jgi:hypothetical protein